MRVETRRTSRNKITSPSACSDATIADATAASTLPQDWNSRHKSIWARYHGNSVEFQLFIRTGKAGRGVCECAMMVVQRVHTHTYTYRCARVCDMRRNNVKRKITIFHFKIVRSVVRIIHVLFFMVQVLQAQYPCTRYCSFNNNNVSMYYFIYYECLLLSENNHFHTRPYTSRFYSDSHII